MKISGPLLLSPILVSVGSAAPSNPLEDRAVCDAPKFVSSVAALASCKQADKACSLRAAVATKFCSVFLGPRSTTVTVTNTRTAPVSDTTTVDSTSTINTGTTLTTAVTTTDPPVTEATTVFATSTQTVTAQTTTIYNRRALKAARQASDDPTVLIIQCAANIISSACSQIYTPTTKSITVSAAQTIHPTVTSTATATAYVTAIHTVTETDEVHITSTVTGTTTSIVGAATTTVTPVLVKPKFCDAKGLPSSNASSYATSSNISQADCIAQCKTDNKCLSTGFYRVTDPSTGTSTSTCRNFDKSVTDAADLGPGYYNFNDKAC